MFRGYSRWNGKLGIWEEDEWLAGLYSELRDARDVLVEWGEGAAFDDNREMKITRYFGKGRDIFSYGKELKEGAIEICEKAWLRYDVFELHERSDKD